MTPPILRTRAELDAHLIAWRQAGETIGVVPTMGALHQGHLSLVEAAEKATDRVIVTIFVNPKQFNEPKDLATYPRTEKADAEKLSGLKVDAIYAPEVAEIYPDGFSTSVSVAGVSDGLCGAGRPGHFDGVATVVAKIFRQTDADFAFFGQKDFQQLQVVIRMARDLDFKTKVVGCETLRETDGLAMSSRNMRLSDRGRARAPGLARAMEAAKVKLLNGGALVETLADARTEILSAGFNEIEYLELRAEDGLTPLTSLSEPARLLAAAWIEGIRLIDNITVAKT